MDLPAFLQRLAEQPASIQFQETIAVIDAHFHFTPTAFKNGELENAAGENNGSCKIFAFADALDLNEAQTLACFGDYYRVDVLQNLGGTDHPNIRQFMKFGWDRVGFAGTPLRPKSA